MSPSDSFAAMLERLEPSVLQGYARARGWRPIEREFDDVVVLGAPDAGLAQLIVPRRSSLADRVELLERAIERLAQFEGRSRETVLDDLLGQHADVLALKVSSTRTENGFLPLVDAVNILAGTRRALQSAAHSVLAPRLRHHPRLGRANVDDFLQRCEMGQTRVGSFVMSIRCSDDPANPRLDDSPPLSRLTLETLHRSVSKLVSAIEADRLDEIESVEEDGVPRITDNLCDALLKMQPADPEAALSLSVSWDRRYAIAPDLRRVVELRRVHFEGIASCYQSLRRREEGAELAYIGRVDELKGDEIGEDGRRSGAAVLSLLVEDEVVKATAMLSAAEYDKAIEAHRRSGFVRIVGRLMRSPRGGRIDAHRRFEMLPESSP